MSTAKVTPPQETVSTIKLFLSRFSAAKLLEVQYVMFYSLAIEPLLYQYIISLTRCHSYICLLQHTRQVFQPSAPVRR